MDLQVHRHSFDKLPTAHWIVNVSASEVYVNEISGIQGDQLQHATQSFQIVAFIIGETKQICKYELVIYCILEIMLICDGDCNFGVSAMINTV